MSNAVTWLPSMTGENADRLKMFREWLTPVTSVIMLLGAITLFLTGGVHTGAQTQYDQMSVQFSSFQASVASQIAGLKADSASQTAALQATILALSTKVEAMPRASDYVGQNARLDELHTEITTLSDRQRADEIANAAIAAAVNARFQQLIDSAGSLTKQPR
jgi:hypothetical protein